MNALFEKFIKPQNTFNMNRSFPILFFLVILSFSTSLKGQLDFQISNENAQVNEFVTVDITVKDFKDIIGLQFGLRWDTTHLQFIDLINFNLPDLSERSFGLPGVGNNGSNQLVISWVTSNFLPVNLPDNSVLFSIRFLALSESPTQTKVFFSEDASSYEVINNQGSLADALSWTDGSIFLNNPNPVEMLPQVMVDSFSRPVCGGSDGFLNVSMTGQTQSYTFEWSGPGNFTAVGSTINGLRAGNYSLLVTDANNRTYCSTFKLNSPGKFLSPNFTSDCVQDGNGKLEVSLGSSSSENFRVDRIQWSNGDDAVRTTFASLDEALFVTVFDQEGCDFTSSAIQPVTLCGNLETDTLDLIAADVALRFIGDTLILPIRANNISELNGLSLSMNWDTADLELVGYAPNDYFKDVPFGLELEEGIFTFGWEQIEASGLEGETELFKLIFKTKGFESSTTVRFSDELRGNQVNDNFIYINVQDATISYGTWPGDTDINGIVNHFDLFNVGLGFGETGPMRANTNSDWEAVKGVDWAESTPINKVNFAFADTDGNGQINQSDVQVVLQNYGQSHPGKNLPPDLIEPRSQNAALRITLDTLVAGNTTNLPINLGNAENPISNIYSIGFSIAYDAPFFEENSLQLDLSDSWLANTSEDLIALIKAVPEAKRIDVAISRIDGQDISGYGEIARIGLNALDQIPFSGTESTLALEITGVRAQDVGENPFSIANSTTMLEVMASSRVQTIPASWFSLFPVPAQEVLNLSSNQNLAIQVLQILDSQGRVLNRISYSNQGIQQTIDVSAYATGSYLLQIFTEKGFVVKKFLIQRD